MFKSIISVLSKYFYNWCEFECVCVLVRLECGEVGFTDTRGGVILCYIIEILIPAYLVLFFAYELIRAGSSVFAISGVFFLSQFNKCQ
jgi:hypothetical protein